MKTFDVADWQAAVALWNNGQDTLQIALAADISEALVYKELPKWRVLFGKPPASMKAVA